MLVVELVKKNSKGMIVLYFECKINMRYIEQHSLKHLLHGGLYPKSSRNNVRVTLAHGGDWWPL